MSDSTDGVDVKALSATVDAVRRDVEGLRRRLDKAPPAVGTAENPEGLVEQVASIEETVTELAATLEKHTATFEQHTAALAALGESDKPAADAPAVVCWLDMVDPEQARVALTGLGTWLGGKLTNYAPKLYREILPCWTKHPDVIQLLLDLQGAYEGAYHAGGRVLDTWDIRTRYLRHTKEALGEAFSDCAGGHGTRSQFNEIPEDPLAGLDLAEIARNWAISQATQHD